MAKKRKNDERTLDELINDILAYVDKRGVVLEKSSTPQSSTLRMELHEEGLHYSIAVFQHAQGNGSCQVEVLDAGLPILKAAGRYIVGAYGMKAEEFVPGPWCSVEQIPRWSGR